MLFGLGCHLHTPAPQPPSPPVLPAAPAAVLTPSRPTPAIRTPPPLALAAPKEAAPKEAAPSGATRASALVAAAEQRYAAALELYREGQLDEARQGFNAAVDSLLASPYEIPATPVLQAELDSLLNRIQALESDTLPAGGLSLTPPQASPLSQILQLTFPLDPATKARLEAKSRVALARARRGELPLTVNDPILRYIHFFTTRGRGDLLRGFRRAGRYRAMVDKEFAAEGIPTDLIYLAQLESGFDPKLTSSVGATGMWQFMPASARGYGLKHTHWIDERMDPEMSTVAAAKHLKSLYAEFGNWYLAMAAYNTGERVIEEIVARTGYADYFKLYQMGALPRSWRNYVPVILAITMIAQNPQQYGITSVDPDPPLNPDTVEIVHPEDLRLAAESAQVTVADLQRLNPALLHYLVPKGYTLKLPQGTLAHYQAAMGKVPPAARVDWRLHWVQTGETWRGLARRYKVSEVSLLRANHARADPAPAPGTPVALPHRITRSWLRP